MRPIIEFCTNNMHHGTDATMRHFEQNRDYDVIEYGCLGNCGQCLSEPFALVNGWIVEADNTSELESKIADKIKEAESEWDLP
jgi:uncharacterized protein YuzB (UPF0349 family)